MRAGILLLGRPGSDRKTLEFLLDMVGYRVFPLQNAAECVNMITQLDKLAFEFTALVVCDRQLVEELTTFFQQLSEPIEMPQGYFIVTKRNELRPLEIGNTVLLPLSDSEELLCHLSRQPFSKIENICEQYPQYEHSSGDQQ